MITELNNINDKTEEGKLLMAALAKITTSTEKKKTPNQVIAQLNKTVEVMYPIEAV